MGNHDLPAGFKMTELGPLPEEWQVVRLGDATRRVKGSKPSKLEPAPSPSSLPYLTAEYFRNGLASQYVPSTILNSVVACTPNDVVLIWDGSKAGNVFAGLEGVLASTMVKVEPVDARLDWSFLFYFLSTQFETLNRQTTGSTIPHVNKQVFQNLLLPLPPLPEQRAIAQVLRTVQRAKEATEKVITALKELKKSLMRHLFTYGPVPVDQVDQVRLKETEIGPLPEHWEVVRLGEICDVKGGKRLPKGHSFSGIPTQHPYIRVIDFADGSVKSSNIKYITDNDFAMLRKYTISSEDVYISIAGTIGLVGTVPEELEGANLTENAAKLVIKSKRKILGDFLKTALSDSAQQRQISALTTKTSQPKLALTRIKQILVPLPPLPEQRAIAETLRTVDQKIAAEEQRKAALDSLFKTLLHHLMTGKVRLAPGCVQQFNREISHE